MEIKGRIDSPSTISQASDIIRGRSDLPASVVRTGDAGKFAWEEFFRGKIRNTHTRRAYERGVRRFLAWVEVQNLELHHITPGIVGEYFDQLTLSHSSKKLQLAGLRAFFDCLVLRHVIVLNPALSVRGPKHQVIEGKTPEISAEQARRLLASINTTKVIGLRDRAIISVLIYTAVRVGAVATLCLKDFEHDGSHWSLRFTEKGGKSREIPVRSDLEDAILAYLEVGAIRRDTKTSPLFRSATGRTGKLTERALSPIDISRMVKRRLKAAGLPLRYSPHSFRVAVITDLLGHGAQLEDVQQLAGHADPRTTRLYDRRQQKVTRNIVERITI
ncbi:MAG: tyrosine-type recombinase/integrase [Thermomicrobiales bacterium]